MLKDSRPMGFLIVPIRLYVVRAIVRLKINLRDSTSAKTTCPCWFMRWGNMPLIWSKRA